MRDNNGNLVRHPFPDANIPRLPKGVVIIGVVVLLSISTLLTVFYTVEPDEIAVVLRFGKYARQTDPGLHFKWPFGLEAVRKVKAQRVLKDEFGFPHRRARHPDTL